MALPDPVCRDLRRIWQNVGDLNMALVEIDGQKDRETAHQLDKLIDEIDSSMQRNGCSDPYNLTGVPFSRLQNLKKRFGGRWTGGK